MRRYAGAFRSEEAIEKRRAADRALKAERLKQETSIDREKRLAYLKTYYRQNKKRAAKWKQENRESVLRQKRESYARHADQVSERNRKKRFARYGLTVDAFEALNHAQNGLCAICGRPEEHGRLHVDHCHATGVVRGLLCRQCNIGLGAFKDNVVALAAAIGYLERQRR